MTETVIMRDSDTAEKLLKDVQAELREYGAPDDWESVARMIARRFVIQRRGFSPGYMHMPPPHPVSAPKQRSEPIGVEVDAGGEG